MDKLPRRRLLGAKYKKVRVLGQGAFGQAVLVHDVDTNTQLVVKRLRHNNPNDNNNRAAINESYNEIESLARLPHPNIVRFHHAWMEGDESTHLNIAMEFCPGGDLTRYVKLHYPVEEATLRMWTAQLLIALDFMHAHRIIHRDIKLANVFLSGETDKVVKIGDFGLSKLLRRTDDATKTQVGTPCYFSPEIAQGKPHNGKTDMWSLGVLLFQLLTKEVPYGARAPNLFLILNEIRNCPVPDPRTRMQRGVKYSDDLCALVQKLMTKDPDKRPTAHQLLTETPWLKELDERQPWLKEAKPDDFALPMVHSRKHVTINVRKRPDFTSTAIGQISHGDKVSVMSQLRLRVGDPPQNVKLRKVKEEEEEGDAAAAAAAAAKSSMKKAAKTSNGKSASTANNKTSVTSPTTATAEPPPKTMLWLEVTSPIHGFCIGELENEPIFEVDHTAIGCDKDYGTPSPSSESEAWRSRRQRGVQQIDGRQANNRIREHFLHFQQDRHNDNHDNDKKVCASPEQQQPRQQQQQQEGTDNKDNKKLQRCESNCSSSSDELLNAIRRKGTPPSNKHQQQQQTAQAEKPPVPTGASSGTAQEGSQAPPQQQHQASRTSPFRFRRTGSNCSNNGGDSAANGNANNAPPMVRRASPNGPQQSSNSRNTSPLVRLSPMRQAQQQAQPQQNDNMDDDNDNDDVTTHNFPIHYTKDNRKTKPRPSPTNKGRASPVRRTATPTTATAEPGERATQPQPQQRRPLSPVEIPMRTSELRKEGRGTVNDDRQQDNNNNHHQQQRDLTKFKYNPNPNTATGQDRIQEILYHQHLRLQQRERRLQREKEQHHQDPTTAAAAAPTITTKRHTSPVHHNQSPVRSNNNNNNNNNSKVRQQTPTTPRHTGAGVGAATKTRVSPCRNAAAAAGVVLPMDKKIAARKAPQSG